MRKITTTKSDRQMPVREMPRKCGFGSSEIRKAMFEDINRGADPIDWSNASQFIHDTRDGKRRTTEF